MTQTPTTELLSVVRAMRDYIDALPSDVVASLPTMPGFDRDWADEVIEAANREAQPVAGAQFKPVADLFALGWENGEVCAYNTDPEKAMLWLAGYTGNCVQEYVKLERLQEAYTAPPAPAVPDIGSTAVNDAAWKLHDTLTEHGPLNGRQFNNLKGCLYEALKIVMNAPPAPAAPDEKAITPAVPELITEDEQEEAVSDGYADSFRGGWNACRAAMLAQPVSQECKLPDNVREALTLALQAMEFMGDTLNNIDAVCTEDVEYVTPAFTAVRGLLAAPEGGND